MTTPQNPYGNDPQDPRGGSDYNSGSDTPRYGSTPKEPAGSDFTGHGDANRPAGGQQYPQQGGQDSAYGSTSGSSNYGEPNYGASTSSGYGQGSGYGDNAGYGAPAAGNQGYGSGQYDAAYADYSDGLASGKPSTLALVALIVGILSLLSIFVLLPAALLPGLLTVILAIVALVRNRKKPKPLRRTGMSVTALILGIITVVVSAVIMAFIVFAVNETGAMNCVEIQDQAAREACLMDAFGME